MQAKKLWLKIVNGIRRPAKARQARPGELETERGERAMGLASGLGDYGLTQGDVCWRVFVWPARPATLLTGSWNLNCHQL